MRVAALGVRVEEPANGTGQPRGTDPGDVGGAEQLIKVDGVDQHQLVLRTFAATAFLATHRAARNARQNGHTVRKRDDA